MLIGRCGNSAMRQQRPGIAYLFIIVQTVMLHDVDTRVRFQVSAEVPEPDYIVSRDLLYAGDTLLVSCSAQRLQRHLDLIVDEGLRYGLEMNWDKVFMLNAKNDGVVYKPSGDPIASKCQVDPGRVLGSILSATADAKPELTRRLGEARSSFDELSKC